MLCYLYKGTKSWTKRTIRKRQLTKLMSLPGWQIANSVLKMKDLNLDVRLALVPELISNWTASTTTSTVS